MTTEQKIIRAKVGPPELAKQLGNVSQACTKWVIAVTAFIASKNFMVSTIADRLERARIASIGFDLSKRGIHPA